MVPEEERHESAVRRHREALVTELKLWEGYLQKVSNTHTHKAIKRCTLAGSFYSSVLCIKVAPGSYLAGAFSMADVIVFPNIAYAFRFGYVTEFDTWWEKTLLIFIHQHHNPNFFSSGFLLDVTPSWPNITAC